MNIRYTSEAHLLSEIEKGNLGYWLYRMFVELPSFNDHAKSTQYDDKVLDIWKNDEFHIPNDIEQCKLVKDIWEILGQAV